MAELTLEIYCHQSTRIVNFIFRSATETEIMKMTSYVITIQNHSPSYSKMSPNKFS